jgi:hypothetical protein
MSERRDLCQQLRLDVFTGDQQLGRLDPDRRRCVNDVLALGNEETELLAPAAVVELPDELELLVLARGDQVVAPVSLPRLWVASTKRCKDAGRGNSGKLLPRPRTRQRAA